MMTWKNRVELLVAFRTVARTSAPSLALAGLLASSVPALAENAPATPNPGIDPYYTGSLLSPSPAIGQAGILAFEPYVIYQRNPGSYGVNGGVAHSTNATSSLSTFTLIKYGITDNFSINVDPQTSINMDSMGFNSGSRIDDLPVEFEYLVTRQDKVTGKPSITLNAGVQTPTGRYENLPSASDGQGSGTYRARAGITLQSLFFGQSLHPIRVRVYGNTLVPLGSTDVHGISTFGTGTGFNGTGYSGLSYGVGTSVEYSITQKLVFALDVFYNGALSSSVNGSVLAAGALTPFNARSGFSDVLQIAPAIEYSLGPRFGIIAGVNFSAEGHNTAQFIQPQIAFNYVFDTSKGLSTFVNPYTGD
jgi:hypothetical protein